MKMKKSFERDYSITLNSLNFKLNLSKYAVNLKKSFSPLFHSIACLGLRFNFINDLHYKKKNKFQLLKNYEYVLSFDKERKHFTTK